MSARFSYRLLRPLVPLCVLLLQPTAVLAEAVTLNLQEADIRAVIDTVSRITGRNFVVDPRVSGEVTVVSAEPLEPEQVYEVFLSVLEVNGYAAVPQGAVIKIVPDVNARQSATPVVGQNGPSDSASLITSVIELRNVPAAQLVPVLRPLVPQNGHVAAYPEANALIISDTAANVERLRQIVRRIDRSGYDDAEIVRLREASASQVAQTLQALTGGDGQGLVADTRTNSIVIAGPPSTRARLRQLIRELDAAGPSEGNTQVVYLRYASAENLVPVLATLLAPEEGAPSSPTPIAATDGDLRGAPTPAPAAVVAADGSSVQAFPEVNALILRGNPEQMRGLRSVIEQLDIRRPQVLVEAIIVEVAAERTEELGLQWLVNGLNGEGVTGVTNFTNGGISARDLGASILANEVPPIGAGLSLLGGEFNGGTDFGALLQALISDSETNVLSTPSLLTLDNQEAEIVVGQNVPFVTGSFATDTFAGGNDGVNPFQTIEREDVGVELRILPQITDGGAIQLTVEQEVSNIAQTTVPNVADIITNKRQIKTAVLVDDGAVIVLGGLIDDQVRERIQKVPGLGDLPVLGSLFRFRDADMLKRNLMVFIRPRVLRLPVDNTRISNEKYNALRRQQLELLDEEGESLLATPPLLPPLPSSRAPAAELPERGFDGDLD